MTRRRASDWPRVSQHNHLLWLPGGGDNAALHAMQMMIQRTLQLRPQPRGGAQEGLAGAYCKTRRTKTKKLPLSEPPTPKPLHHLNHNLRVQHSS